MAKLNSTKSFYSQRNLTGFTLIETLIVIGIIGVISSIIVVGISNSRAKARIVAGLEFSSSLKSTLGADLVGEWKFEEPRDNTCVGGGAGYDDFCDSSGNNNHGQNYDYDVIRQPNAEIPQLGQQANTGAHNSSIPIADSDTLDISNAITIEGWVKTSVNDNNWGLLAKPSAYYLAVKDNKLVFSLFPFLSSNFSTLSCGLNSAIIFNDNKWHHFAGTWASGSKRKIFVDGKEICSDVSIPSFTSINNSNYPISLSMSSINGSLDEVRIYAVGLSSAQIQQHYTEGAKKRGLLAEK